jgi:hypothetical protein
MNGKQVLEFFEVIPTFLAPCVVSTSRNGRLGGICSKCAAEFIYDEPGKTHISRRNADQIKEHGAAAIDSYSRPSLCVTERVWDEIKKLKIGRGLLNHVVTELDEESISNKPKLEKIVPFKL